ncbi:MAG: type II secretion system GspH family protein [Acidobacteriota bacterium]|nr:type II secretion system GspH family protein [Acidobacteriota bacterium]
MTNKQNPKSKIQNPKSDNGFTLFELIITLTVLAILVMGTIPLTQNAAKRERELRLRENLRLMRSAIDEFKRDTVGACQGGIANNNQAQQFMGGGGAQADPRSRVMIDDCKIFETDNLDRYPPTLELLAEGVKVRARGLNIQGGRPFDDKQVTELNENKELNKVYLREMPVDPMTGEADWKFRSSFQGKDDESWDEINVFDVRSSSDGEALNGEKYSDW